MKSHTMLFPVILSGGSGSRLWPLSREHYPKQLLPLAGKESLLQQTIQRLTQIDCAEPIVIANFQHRFLIAEQLQQIGCQGQLILEPDGRNTAPAAAIAALHALQQDANAVLLIMPADHQLEANADFISAINTACEQARQGRLVTFGIHPTTAATAYGYIKTGQELAENCFAVSQFIEKPDNARAQAFVTSGQYLWNSGLFVFHAATYLAALAQFAPAILTACQSAYSDRRSDLFFNVLGESAWANCPSTSIDYAVMEKVENAAVVPLACPWTDLGAWDALYAIGEKDAAGNVIAGDVILHQVHNSYIYAHDRLVAAIGVDDHIIVETADAVLVADKKHSQAVKTIVEKLKANNRPEALWHKRVYRPWGYYENLQAGLHFQVKRLQVNPGAQLSLQQHQYRSEHWVVVHGIADIIKGDQTLQLQANQSTYIPQGMLHRLGNSQAVPLEVIEVQSGSYLGEDDIVRFADDYQRTIEKSYEL